MSSRAPTRIRRGAEPAPHACSLSRAAPAIAGAAQLGDRVAAAGAELHFGEIDAGMVAEFAAYDVVVVLEPYVLPLPGVIEAAAAVAAAEPGAAVAGKVVRADGRLEGAGGTVFADRSLGLIAESTTDLRAPWHDYVRPVCWAHGLVAAAAPLWLAVEGPGRTHRPAVRPGVVRGSMGSRRRSPVPAVGRRGPGNR